MNKEKLELNRFIHKVRQNKEHIAHVARMTVPGYRGCRFEPRHQYVVLEQDTLSALLQSTQLFNGDNIVKDVQYYEPLEE